MIRRTLSRARHAIILASRGAAGVPPLPITAQIEVTNRCNLICRTCTRLKLPKLGDMSYDEFLRVIEAIGPVERLWLSGQGEPLLHRDLPRMIRACAERGIGGTVVHTNGMLLHGAMADGIAESGLGELRVSIDAGTSAELEYMRAGSSMEQILANVRAFTGRGPGASAGAGAGAGSGSGPIRLPVTTFYCVLNRHSIDTAHLLPGIAASCGVRGVTMVETVPFRDESTEREIYDRREYQFASLPATERAATLDRIRSEAARHGVSVDIDLHWYRKRCFEPFDKIYVDFEGNVTPCCRIHNEVFVGNLLRDGIGGAWNSGAMAEWRGDVLRRARHRRICIERCNLGIGETRRDG